MALAINSRPRGNHAINMRQAKEDARREIVKQTDYYARTKLLSEFEENTTAQIVHNAIKSRFKQLQEAFDATIDERRVRLARLLEGDYDIWRAELLAMEETKEARLDKMRARATELKQRREREREKIVEEKLYQRWKSGCDELRAVESKALEREAAVCRVEQMREKHASMVAAEEERRKWDEIWEAERQKKVVREEFERDQRRAVDAATTAILEEQMIMLREKAQEEEKLIREEARLMREEMELRRMEEERARLRRLQDQRRTRQELDYFNKMRMQQRAKEVQDALEMDMRIVSEFAAIDESERLEKVRRKEELRNETQMYRQHLAEQKEIEERRAREIEHMYAKEQEKYWRTRALNWQQEQDARDRLMADVIEGRREQIRRKIERNREEAARTHLEKERLLQSIEEAKGREAERRQKAHVAQKVYKGDLESQIRVVEDQRQAKKEKDIDEARLEQEAERRYQSFLEQELAKVDRRFRNVNLSAAADAAAALHPPHRKVHQLHAFGGGGGGGGGGASTGARHEYQYPSATDSASDADVHRHNNTGALAPPHHLHISPANNRSTRV